MGEVQKVRLNPRSFKDIRRAIREGDVGSRGQLLREMHDAFRAPALGRRTGEINLSRVDEDTVGKNEEEE